MYTSTPTSNNVSGHFTTATVPYNVELLFGEESTV
jgi:hypothetical protein